MPKIGNQLLDAVVYLYGSESNANDGVRAGGSGFVLGVWSQPQNLMYLYVVTNRHVVQKGCSVVRMTSGSDEVVVKVVPEEDWVCPRGTNDDLAIWLFGTQHLTNDINFSAVSFDRLIMKESVSEYSVGDDCFMLGRFVTHDGRQRNLPTARFGNISMLPTEPVEVGRDEFADLFMVETRSQAGYSGSPVFLYREKTAVSIPVRPSINYTTGVRNIEVSASERVDIKLLGVNLGQFPRLATIVQVNDSEEVIQGQHPELPKDARVELGSSMIGVVPAWKLLDLVNREDVRSVRQESRPSYLIETPGA